ncbi:MAG: rRNA maturation RNase YbeY [Bacteroidota bacterium]
MSYRTNKKGEIYFFSEDIEFNLDEKKKISQWIIDTAGEYSFKIDNINYIFVSDNYLLEMNKRYLKHKTLTDIITFDNSFFNLGLSGDIYISIDRVRENAVKYMVDFQEELCRVMIHGLLHLCGFKDKFPAEKDKMIDAENLALLSYNL